MGYSRAVTYGLKIRCVSGRYYTPMEWRVRGGRLTGPGMGAPTAENIDRWVRDFEESMRSGCNRHLGVDQVVSAEIIDYRTDGVVATWTRKAFRPAQPMFEVI